LGPPDLVLAPAEEFTVGPTGPDIMRCFVLPTGLTEDKHVVAFELRPGNRRVVHHTLHFLDVAGRARKLEQREQQKPRREDGLDQGPGYSSRMGPGLYPPSGEMSGWAPGISPNRLPEGVGYFLPKEADVILQVHYHRTGRVEKDRPQLGLYFARKPVERSMQPVIVTGRFLTIPAGAKNYGVKGDLWLAEDCLLHSVTPHMHLLGKSIRVTLTPPGGQPLTVVGISAWDYDWQEIYYFKEPIKASAGTHLHLEAVYDNSADNPRNPRRPPARVFLGEETTNEMCFVFFGATVPNPRPIGFRLSPDSFVLRLRGLTLGPQQR